MSITIRYSQYEDLSKILILYTQYNHDIPRLSENRETSTLWKHILDDPNLHYFVGELDGDIVTTCFLAVIPHLASGKPYGLSENVITDEKHRNKGHGLALLRYALQVAWENNCCHVMLSTGSRKESTLRFYQKAGFQRDIKKGHCISVRFLGHETEIRGLLAKSTILSEIFKYHMLGLRKLLILSYCR